jgi:hypothetical protein
LLNLLKRWLRPIYLPILGPIFWRWPRLNPKATIIREIPTYAVGGLATNVSDNWRTPRFLDAYDAAWTKIESLGLADRHIHRGAEWKCHTACWAAATASRLEGDFVECGVGFGMTSSVVMNYIDTPKFWLIDAWGGEVPLDEGEIVHRYATADQARAVFSDLPQAQVVHGVVPSILDTVTIERVSYLHVDMNSWQADLAAIEHFWPRLVIGAIVIIDDFGFGGFEKTREAMDDFAARNGTAVLYSPIGPGMIVKT